jgi:hypothetical protein
VNAHLQEAMEHIAAVAERARYLTRDEQEALAVKSGAAADRLRWEQCLLLHDRFLTDQVTVKASAAVITLHMPHMPHI